MIDNYSGVSFCLMPGGFDDDVSGVGFAHGNSLEAPVVQQGHLKNGRAENMSRFRCQHNSLIGCLCEDEGDCKRVSRRTGERPINTSGGQADALKRRLRDCRTVFALLLFSSRAGGLAGWAG